MRNLLIAVALLVFPAAANAAEEPDYAVVRKLGSIEVRYYASYVAAQVLVSSNENMAGNQAVPILADYIFGNNKGEKTFARKAPATQTSVPVHLEMMAPVTRTAAPGGYLVQFVLPKSVTLESAPEPIDSRVQLRTVPENRLAAIIFSGFWSEANYAEHLDLLTAALRAADLPWTGEPVYARYNTPSTPWFKRRNEIWLTLR